MITVPSLLLNKHQILNDYASKQERRLTVVVNIPVFMSPLERKGVARGEKNTSNLVVNFKLNARWFESGDC